MTGDSIAKSTIGILAVCGSLLAVGATARAQNAGTDLAVLTEQTPIAGDATGDIVVTARKTNERLQDVPISVNALTGDQLRERGAVDVKDVLRAVPGLSFSGVERGQSNYNIRGVSTVASSPTVGIYLDDISLVTIATNFSGALDPVFFDMERLEVLKGPQGTLYGGSSMGGAIKYVSAKPDVSTLGGDAAAGIATTAHGSASYNAEGVMNVPLVTDRLAIRGGLFYRHDGGYIDNSPGLTIQNSNRSSTPSPAYTPLLEGSLSSRTADNQNDANTYVGRLSLLWKPDPSWSIQPAAFYQDYKLNNPSLFVINEPGLQTSYRMAQPTHDQAGIYSLSIEKNLGWGQATSLTAYVDRKLDFTRDYSFFDGNLVPPLYPLNNTNTSNSRTKTVSQELRLASTAGIASRFHWLAGLYYSRQDDRLIQIVTVPGAVSILGTETGYFGDTRTITSQYAAFGEATYRIVGELELTAGVRLFKIEQSLDAAYNGPFNGPAPATITARRSNDDGVNPKIGLSYKVTQDNLIYASATKGFRPGGPNRFLVNPALCSVDLGRLGLTAAPGSFKSDSLWTYELGTKNKFVGNRVLLNAAVFYTDWTNIQQLFELNSCGFNFASNAGTAHIKGAEGEARFNLTPAFQVGGNATYTDARIVAAAAGTTVQNGDEVQAVPRWMASAYASYGTSLGTRWNLELRGEYQYQDQARRQFDRVQAVSFPNGIGLVPNAAEFRPGYEVINAFAALNDKQTELRIYANNIFDARPYIDESLSTGIDSATTIRPRTIGIELRQRF